MNLKTLVNKYNREPDYINHPSDSGVGPYYITWTFEHLRRKFPLSNEGIPLQDWDITLFRNRCGRVVNPHAVAQYALSMHNEYLCNNKDTLADGFLVLADWFVENQKKDKPFKGCWAHNYEVPEYHLPSPWYCGMTQGQVSSALVRAYVLSGRQKYLDSAVAACEPLMKITTAGGVKHVFDGDVAFFEEMPTNFFPHILNHHIYAVYGLFDVLRVYDEQSLKVLFDEAVCSIEKTLDDFDTGFWSRYKIGGRPTMKNHFNWASPFYHRHHVVQLEVLYSMTNRKKLKAFAQRWDTYARGMLGIFLESVYVCFRMGVLTSKFLRKKLKKY